MTLPPGWTEYKNLPSSGPFAADGAPLLELEEDLWQATDPSGRFVLDVGWYPEGDEAGAFTCVLIEDGDWEAPLSKHRTRSLEAVREWVERGVSRVQGMGVRTHSTSTAFGRRDGVDGTASSGIHG